MPWLSRSAAGSGNKRPSVNSSFQGNDSVWHSTPIDSTTDGDGPSGANSATTAASSKSSNIADENDVEGISPVKRPALGEGDRPLPFAGAGARIVTPAAKGAAPSRPAGLLGSRLISTPAALTPQRTAIQDVVMESGDDDEDLFADMLSSGGEHQVNVQGKAAPTASKPKNNTPPPVTSQSQPSNKNNTQTTAASQSQQGESQNRSLHISSRFGTIVINPPSGHTYFSRILHENGFILTTPKNHLVADVLHFREKLGKWLDDHSNEMSRIEDETTRFLKGLKKYFSTKENILHSLTTTLNDREIIQPSLMACLLGVKLLQMPLLEVSLPTLYDASTSNLQADSDFVGSFVNQMKWLPVLADGKAFADKLLDILETASIYSQKHIVRLLPEIFLPEFHSGLVPRLMEIFDIGTQLNVTMLDCFSSLVTPEADCLKIRRAAVDQMTNAPLEDLPAYFSFLFRVGSPAVQLEDGIKEMREKLEIKPRLRISKEDALQMEVLERIRFLVSVNPMIIKIWLAQIKEDFSCDLDLSTMDLLMVLVFVEGNDKSAQIALTALFTRPKLVSFLFEKMAENNNQILVALFPTVALFLDTILRGKNMKLHDATIAITKKLFVGLGPIMAQHLISNMVSILINGFPVCRDSVLKILKSIAETDPKKLLYFHSYLMGVLHYVIKYPPRQMQGLMQILATLAYMPENLQGEENSFTAEFMILLRKQITHTSVRTRCFGVLGSISAVYQLAIQDPIENEGKIDGLLALVWVSIENDEKVCSIFFDHLIEVISSLPKVICSRFRNILKSKFEKLWTLAMDQASDSQLFKLGKGKSNLLLETSFDANKELDRDKLIIILEPQILQMSPLVIPSHFRVMAELEKVAEGGELEGIDAVIGCPLFFPKLSYFEKEKLEDMGVSEREHLGQYLVIAINYFRECVSAFVGCTNKELSVKIWLRLQNIVNLQKLLVKYYTHLPNLPMGYGNENSLDDAPATSGFGGGPSSSASAAAQAKKNVAAAAKKPKPKPKAPKKPKKKGKKKQTKKKKNSEEDDEEEAVEEEEEEIMDIDDEEDGAPENGEENGHTNQYENLEDTLQPNFISSNIRHFGKNVFELLQFPFKLREEPINYSEVLHNLSTATQSNVTMNHIEAFDTESLSLLLMELKAQTTDTTWDFDILSVPSLLDCLCSHLDAVSQAVQSMDEETVNSGKTKAELYSCMRLIINLLDLYFDAISKKSEKEVRVKLTKEAVIILAARYKSDSQEQEELDERMTSQIEVYSNVARYVGSFAKVFQEDSLLAHEHVKLLKSFHDLLSRQDEVKTAIDEVMRAYLQRNWKLPANVINYFLKTWLAVTPLPMTVMKHLIDNLIPTGDEEANQNNIPNSSVYQTCTKINFQTWYSALLAGLAQHVMKRGRRRGDFEDSIDLWTQGNDLLVHLVQVSQKQRKAPLLIALLRSSRTYMEAFISGGIGLLPQFWKENPQNAHDFTKKLQNSTRKLQSICEHAKVIKDNTLLRYVPNTKRILEVLLFRVREVLSNVAPGAFWMGPLKLRNLDGKVISSQPFKNCSESEDSDEDQTETRENASDNNNSNAVMDTEESNSAPENEGSGEAVEEEEDRWGNSDDDDNNSDASGQNHFDFEESSDEEIMEEEWQGDWEDTADTGYEGTRPNTLH